MRAVHRSLAAPLSAPPLATQKASTSEHVERHAVRVARFNPQLSNYYSAAPPVRFRTNSKEKKRGGAPIEAASTELRAAPRSAARPPATCRPAAVGPERSEERSTR